MTLASLVKRALNLISLRRAFFIALMLYVIVRVSFAQNLQNDIQVEQSEVDANIISIVDKGIELHKQEKYQQAIDVYLKGLEIYADSEYLHYEIAYSYFNLKQYDKVIDHTNRIIAKNEKLLLEAFSIKSSAQDINGDFESSIATFTKAIATFPNNHLLRFNLGVTLFRTGDLAKAQDSFIQAIELNPSHASSHYLLAYLNQETNNQVKAMLGYYFFLMLEPNTERSTNGVLNLIRLQQQSVQKKSDSQMNINISPDSLDNGLETLELSIAISMAANDLEGEKTEHEKWVTTSEMMFELFDEAQETEDNFWLKFYGNFFAKLHAAGHTEAFIQLISQSNNEAYSAWLEANQNKHDAFIDWLNG